VRRSRKATTPTATQTRGFPCLSGEEGGRRMTEEDEEEREEIEESEESED